MEQAKSKDAPEVKANRIAVVLQMLPDSNKVLLMYMLRFFTEITKHSDKNLMGIENLSIIISPNIIRCPGQSLDSAKDLPLVADIFKHLLSFPECWIIITSHPRGLRSFTSAVVRPPASFVQSTDSSCSAFSDCHSPSIVSCPEPEPSMSPSSVSTPRDSTSTLPPLNGSPTEGLTAAPTEPEPKLQKNTSKNHFSVDLG